MGNESPSSAGTAASPASASTLRFGLFELDLRTAELRKGGIRIKLNAQPFAVLALLLERPGEIVTREEIQQKLWTSDTFVDFEHGLNKAINKVRDALGDDADNPRFIETLPRRGYRFIAPVEPNMHAPPADPPVETLPAARTTPRWAIAAVALVAAALLIAGFAWLRSPLPSPRVLRYHQLTSDSKEKNRPCFESFSRLVTDGTRVYFSEANLPILAISVTGGDITPATSPLDCFGIFAISPDGTQLLGARSLLRNDLLWQISTVDGLKHPVGDLRGHAAAWSPDGQTIAYATGPTAARQANDLYTARRDGTQPRKLARFEQGEIAGIAWSPDGRLLRLDVWQTDSVCIWEISADGSNLHQLAITPTGNNFTPFGSWTRDQKYFVFAANTDSGGRAIWALRERPSLFRKSNPEPVQLTSSLMNFWQPAISPDGKQIFAIGGIQRGQLLSYDVQSKRLEPYLSGISAEQLSFSPDGQWVAYITYPEAVLWRSRLDGSQRMQLTTPPLRAYQPRWSPDGTQIAFAARLPGQWLKLYVVSAEGGQPKQVSESDDNQADPNWSSDGHSLIFDSGFFSAHPAIRSLDLRTGQVSLLPNSQGLYGVLVSPDGRFLVAMDTPGNHKLLMFDLRTQQWDELVTLPTVSPVPLRWSSDNRYLYFTFNSDPFRLPLYRLRIADRKVEELAVITVPEGILGVFSPQPSLAPDGSLLLLRDASIQEIYALDVDLP